jgi:hypothetical protein
MWPPDDPPRPVWRPYGTDPLPSTEEALHASLRAFPYWFLRIECERCGKVRMLNEAHASAVQRVLRLRDLLAPARGLRWPSSEGRADDRRRRCQQPPGAANRAAGWQSIARLLPISQATASAHDRTGFTVALTMS